MLLRSASPRGHGLHTEDPSHLQRHSFLSSGGGGPGASDAVALPCSSKRTELHEL